MFRKLKLVLLAGTICLSGIAGALAGEIEFYELKDYEQLTGKKLEYQQAPMLKTMVAAGELPRLEERLPEEPLVVKPLEEIGQYGGTLRILNERGYGNYGMVFGFEFLANYAPDMSYIYPNVLKGWKVSDNAKKFTLYLRKGMRWSDGVPFTADDFMFWYEDVALNKELSPVPPSMLVAGGKVGVMRKIDDYTLEVSFDVPFGTFIENFCRWRPNPYLPKHYFKQFHPKYTSMDKIEKMVKEKGQASWVTLFGKNLGTNADWFAFPERPIIGAWVAQNLPGSSLQVMSRNPYYWKVDTEGKQLPYIDKITRLLVMETEAMLLEAIAGNVDLQKAKYFEPLKNYSLIMENREKGNYRVLQSWWPPNNYGVIFFNFSHKDPILRKLFLDKNFRIALSVALNREELNTIIFKGFAVPSQPTSASGTPFYGERLFKNYLQYDPQLANQLLDEMGLDERDEENYRLRPDGKRLRLACIVMAYPIPMDMAEEYTKYLKAIGIEVVNRSRPASMFQALYDSGEYDIAHVLATWGGRPMNPLYRVMMILGSAAPQWVKWIQSKGEKGEKPPEDVIKIETIRQQALLEPDEQKRIALTLEMFKILEKNLWIIGALNEPEIGNIIMVSNRLGNVPEDIRCSEGLYSIPTQYFFKK